MDHWKKCSSCKKSIAFEATFWVCNVSTCNRKRTGLAFCSVSCWDAHVPQMNHRESWAVEHEAPSKERWDKVLAGEEPDPFIVRSAPKEEEKKDEPVKPVASGPAKVILRRQS